MLNIKIQVRQLDRGFTLEWNTWDDGEEGEDGEEPKEYLWEMALSTELELRDALGALGKFARGDCDLDQEVLASL